MNIKKKLCSKKAEIYVDVGVKILISVVIGALLLSGMYCLFDTVVMPTVKNKVETMFDYSGDLGGTDGSIEEIYYFTTCPTVDLTKNESDTFSVSRMLSAGSIVEMLIDGEAVDSSKYRLMLQDETSFRLGPAVVQNLTEGMHTVKVVFEDGYAQSTFEAVGAG